MTTSRIDHDNLVEKSERIDPDILYPHYRVVIRDITNSLIVLAVCLIAVLFFHRNDASWNYPTSLFLWLSFIAFNGAWTYAAKDLNNYATLEHVRVTINMVFVIVLFYVTGGAANNFWYPAAFCVIGSSTAMYLVTGKIYWVSLAYPIAYLVLFALDSKNASKIQFLELVADFSFLIWICVIFFRMTKIIGNIGIDLANERLASAHHLQQTAAAEASSQAKSQFIAHINHELRTPLAVISGFAEMLGDAAHDQHMLNRYVGTIKRNTKHLNSLIDDILDISKIESGELISEKVICSPKEEVFTVTEMFAEKVKTKNISLISKFSSEIPEKIEVDSTRLRQILINLVGNAVKFTDSGSIELVSDYQNGYLHFKCIDSGCGIRVDQQENVFAAFSQEDSSTSRIYGGTGLGLYLSKKLAQLLNGDIVILESIPGRGSTFEFTIPVTIPQSIQTQTENVAPVIEKRKFKKILRAKILLAEDNIDSQALFSRTFNQWGVAIDLASNGFEAVDMSNQIKYDMILMDLQMPGMDGYEAFKIIKSRQPDLPIVAVTANATKEEKTKAISLGFAAFTTKPLEFNILFNLMEDLLE